MDLLVYWTIMAFVVAIIAGRKGRSAIGWFIYGFLIWPIALVHALVMKPDDDVLVARGAARKCPACAELVKPEAVKCRHCGEPLDSLPAKPRTSGGIDLTPNPTLPPRRR